MYLWAKVEGDANSLVEELAAASFCFVETRAGAGGLKSQTGLALYTIKGQECRAT